MGFFDWLSRQLRRLRGEPEELPPPEPMEEEYQEEEVYIPPEEEEPETEEEDCSGECIIDYLPGRREGRIQVIPRWRTSSQCAECVRELFRQAGIRSYYNVVVCGEVCSEYDSSGHEGETEICLTYKFEGVYMRTVVNGIYVDALDFVNIVNYEYGSLVECWATVTEIAVLDN